MIAQREVSRPWRWPAQCSQNPVHHRGRPIPDYIHRYDRYNEPAYDNPKALNVVVIALGIAI